MENKEEVVVCFRCKQPKPRSDFRRNSRAKNGLQSSCKSCKSKKSQKTVEIEKLYQQAFEKDKLPCLCCLSIKDLENFSVNKNKVNSKRKGRNQWCKECVNTYNKKYIKENRDELNAKQRKYYQDNREKIISNVKVWYQENKDYRAEYLKQYYEKNADKLREKSKLYRQKNKRRIARARRIYAQVNAEQIAQYKKRYREDPQNKSVLKAAKHRRKNRVKNAEGNQAETEAILRENTNKCFLTKQDDAELEHFIPIYRGGNNTLMNCYLANPHLNKYKMYKNPFYWLEEVKEERVYDIEDSFNQLVEYLAEQNNMSIPDYITYVESHFPKGERIYE